MFDREPLAPGDFQPMRVQSQKLQYRRVDVGDVVAVLHGVEAELVRCAVDDAASNPAAGHPDREAKVVVVAAVGTLAQGVRPNSVVQTTSVSSSSPRRFKSMSKPAIGLST